MRNINTDTLAIMQSILSSLHSSLPPLNPTPQTMKGTKVQNRGAVGMSSRDFTVPQ